MLFSNFRTFFGRPCPFYVVKWIAYHKLCGRHKHLRKNALLAAVVSVVAKAPFNEVSRCHDFAGTAENMQTGLKTAVKLHVSFGETTPYYIPGSLQDLCDSRPTAVSWPLTPQFHCKRLVLLNKEVAQSSWTVLSSSFSFFCFGAVLFWCFVLVIWCFNISRTW